MTALIVIASIALLFFVLLSASINAELEYDKVFKFKIKYLFFTIAKDPLSPKEQKRKEKKAEKKKRKEEKKKRGAEKKACMQKKNKPGEKTAEKNESKADTAAKTESGGKTAEDNKASPPEKKKKKSGVTPDLIMRILGKAKPHIKRLFKKIRVSGVYVDIVVGGDDAAKTAISYGVHCAAVDGLAAFLDNTITFKAEKIGIRADFDLEKSEYYARAAVKLRMSTLLHSGIWGALAIRNELMSITAATEKAPADAPNKAA